MLGRIDESKLVEKREAGERQGVFLTGFTGLTVITEACVP
jgi:hypothetical protein